MINTSSGCVYRNFSSFFSLFLWIVSMYTVYLPITQLLPVHILRQTFRSSTDVIWYPHWPCCKSLTLVTGITVFLLCIGCRPEVNKTKSILDDINNCNLYRAFKDGLAILKHNSHETNVLAKRHISFHCAFLTEVDRH